MEIVGLPSEILIHIFSYLETKDLVNNVIEVCDMWTEICLSPELWHNLDFYATFKDAKQPYKHLSKISRAVRSLKIHPEWFDYLLEKHYYIYWSSVKCLHVTEEISNYLVEMIVKECRHIEDLRVLCKSSFDMKRGLECLSKLQLTSLDLAYFGGSTNKDDDLTSFINKQSRLRKLSLRGWYYLEQSTVARIVDQHPNITSLYVSNVSSEMLTRKTVLPMLQEFTVHSNYFDNDGLFSLATRAGNLRILDVRDCVKITADKFLTLTKNFPLLEKIYFERHNSYPFCNIETGIQVLSEECTRLKLLHFVERNVQKIPDVVIDSLFSSCRHLQFIVLDTEADITDDSLLVLSENCNLLEKFHLSNCNTITTKGITFILIRCDRLRKLTLINCLNLKNVKIEDDAPTVKQTTHSHLLELNLSSCKSISLEAVLQFSKLCPDLRLLNLSNCLLYAPLCKYVPEIFINCGFLDTITVHNSIEVKRKLLC